MSKIVGAVAVPAFIVIIVALALLDVRVVIEAPLLRAVLATLFLTATTLPVAYISARSYLTSGSHILLFLSSGVLAFSSASLVAFWLLSPILVPAGGPNVGVTIYRTGVLVASVFHVVSGSLSLTAVARDASKPRKSDAIVAYLGVLVFIALLTMASLQGGIPLFFEQGLGHTSLGLAITATAVALFTVSSLLFWRLYSKSKSDVLYWYSLALALIATGLFSFSVARAVGDPFSWTGVSAQFLGGVYFLIAVLTTVRRPRSKET